MKRDKGLRWISTKNELAIQDEQIVDKRISSYEYFFSFP